MEPMHRGNPEPDGHCHDEPGLQYGALRTNREAQPQELENSVTSDTMTRPTPEQRRTFPAHCRPHRAEIRRELHAGS